jgi:hypothetical protein
MVVATLFDNTVTLACNSWALTPEKTTTNNKVSKVWANFIIGQIGYSKLTKKDS